MDEAKYDNANPVQAVNAPIIVVIRKPTLFAKALTNGPPSK